MYSRKEYATFKNGEDENYAWDSGSLVSFFLSQIAKPATKVAEIAADIEIHSSFVARM